MMSWSLELCNEKPHCHYHWTYFEIGIEWDFSMPCSVLARICCPYYPHMLCCPWYFCGILFGCGSLSCNKYMIICCHFLKSWNQIAGICHWVSCCGSCSACAQIRGCLCCWGCSGCSCSLSTAFMWDDLLSISTLCYVKIRLYASSAVSLVWSLCEIRWWRFSGTAAWNIWARRNFVWALAESLANLVRAFSEYPP